MSNIWSVAESIQDLGYCRNLARRGLLPNIAPSDTRGSATRIRSASRAAAADASRIHGGGAAAAARASPAAPRPSPSPARRSEHPRSPSTTLARSWGRLLVPSLQPPRRGAVVAAVAGAAEVLGAQLLSPRRVEGQQVLVLHHPLEEEGEALRRPARVRQALGEGGPRDGLIDEADDEAAAGM